MNYRVKTAKNFRQFDTRWSKLSYKVLPACVRLNGCGATALADVVATITKYKDYNVKNIRKWLLDHGYVSKNQGTYWAGISACLKAYGFKNVKNHPTMPEYFKAMAKGNRVSIILFNKGSRGGRTYTGGAHFCAISGYMEKNGKHYLYVNDPGPRLNDGWICYETQMKGLVLQIWSAEIPDVKPAATTTEKKQPAKTTTSETPKTEKSSYRGFDISYAQNGLDQSDFNKAKKAGWDFVIIRLGTVLKGTLYTDAEFEQKYKRAKTAGLDVGVYFYSMAKTVADAKKEAEYVVKQLAGRELTLPVFIDYEDPTQKNVSKKVSKNLCEAFCKVITDAGYDAGVYASYDWLNNHINPIDKKYYVWLAQYPKATYKGRYEMHQYSSSGKVTGIGNKIDVNVSVIKPTKKPVKKTEAKPAATKTETKPAVKKTNAQKIAEAATKLAYADAPDEAKYPSGKPKPEYKDALNECYPDRSKWSAAPKAGASCDVFVGTTIRSSGVDSKFPRGLDSQKSYLEKSEKFDKVKSPTLKTLQDGDVILYEEKDGTEHICIYAGGKIKHASIKKWYGRTTNNAKAKMDTSDKKYVKVYRAK